MENLPNQVVPYSGMPITETPEREHLDSIIGEAYEAWYSAWGRLNHIERANDIANSADHLPGVTIVDPGDYGTDYHNRCVHYVFGTVLEAEWATPYQEIPSQFWGDTIGFLKEQQVFLVEDVPQAGDIVAYSLRNPIEIRAPFKHFGILQEDGTITSKFGQGPVLQHTIDLIPHCFGDYTYFLRPK